MKIYENYICPNVVYPAWTSWYEMSNVAGTAKVKIELRLYHFNYDRLRVAYQGIN